ncbi:hypothetical protein BDV97DRAFT_352418 [Delphinella strobiligena]|nr:hypothetical protein BDV97DRAFT_352418 [Delphinella strobiligena]
MTPLISPSARKQQQQGRTPSVPQTPTPAPETSETPIRSERRRGLLPGSVNPQRTPRNKDTPRPKPVERNADKRAQNLEQAAERKRIQEQADALEEEKRKAEQKQHQLDAQDSSQHHAGDKRKRVRIDDLKTIPARRPGESSGTFSFRPEFFEYDSDPEEDDYVEMDIDEAEELVISRPAKKIRYEDNVFNTPQTPVTSLQRQIGQATQYTPKQPSSLRRVSGIGSSGTTPRQISAATPAPVYYRTPAPLGDITEITEPSETPMPAPRSQAPAPTPGSNAFGFPAAADLWVNIPGITREMVEDACKIPPSQVEIDAAARQFAAGVEAYLAVH